MFGSPGSRRGSPGQALGAGTLPKAGLGEGPGARPVGAG